MSATSTLARRFRSQRTDRIRLEGEEVFSKIEIPVPGPTIIEIAFESCRTDCAEGLGLLAPEFPFMVTATDVHVVDPAWTETDQLSLLMPPKSTVQLRGHAEEPSHLTLWNIWMHEGTEHAWTGNSGMMVERLENPVGASDRMRLWCSDGLGDPSFDDLVVVVTVGAE